MLGIVYAIISMLFAGLNDFLFKEISNRSQRITGLFLAGVGFVWMLVFAIGLWATGARITGSHWPITVGAGVVSILANVIFLQSYRYFPASTGATIYRLNLVVVAVLSFVWLGESITQGKLIGIAFGVIAVVALQWGVKHVHQGKGALIGIALLLVACVLRAVMGILYKLATIHGVPPFELLAINGASWMVGGLVAAIIAREPLRQTDAVIWRTAGISGILVCGIVYFMLVATKYADASIAIPITQMGFLLTGVLGIVFHGETITRQKSLAFLAAIAAIISLTMH